MSIYRLRRKQAKYCVFFPSGFKYGQINPRLTYLLRGPTTLWGVIPSAPQIALQSGGAGQRITRAGFPGRAEYPY